MKKVLVYSFVIAAVLSLISCAAEDSAQSPSEIVAVEEVAADPITVIDLETVTVSAEGTGFESPVQIAQIPDGAWFCDMGTVHYARLDAGDEKCAICGMNLVQKVAGMNTEIIEHVDEEIIETIEEDPANKG